MHIPSSCVGETHLFARGPDVDALAILVIRLEFIVVDTAVLDDVIGNLRVDYIVLQPHTFPSGMNPSIFESN